MVKEMRPADKGIIICIKAIELKKKSLHPKIACSKN